ncbi:MAG: hypothetical protein EOS85_33010 [Mesorhizobium sp.]|nr:MAG: hypothetical protein EOS85_33010 [Mesorhizobium sp.]
MEAGLQHREAAFLARLPDPGGLRRNPAEPAPTLRRASLAGSAGCFLGRRAHFELGFPGLYGGNPFINRTSPFRQVVSVHARLLHVKSLRHGDYLGYGRLDRDSLIGVIALGYADGLRATHVLRLIGISLGSIIKAGRLASQAGCPRTPRSLILARRQI